MPIVRYAISGATSSVVWSATATVLAPLVPALFSVRIEEGVPCRAITASTSVMTTQQTQPAVGDAPRIAIPVLPAVAYALFATICTTSTQPTPTVYHAVASATASTVIPRQAHAPPAFQASF